MSSESSSEFGDMDAPPRSGSESPQPHPPEADSPSSNVRQHLSSFVASIASGQQARARRSSAAGSSTFSPLLDSLWRHDPVPVARTTNLPRGGRTLPAPITSTTSTDPRRRQLFSPPPPSSDTPRSPIPPVPSLAEWTTDLRTQFLVEPTHLVGESFNDNDDNDDESNVSIQTRSETLTERSSLVGPNPRRHTREQSYTLQGRDRRSHHTVYLVYCGGNTEQGQHEPDQPLEERSSKGCGTLICSRALLDDKLPPKMFQDSEPRGSSTSTLFPSLSSDLPPNSMRLGDLVNPETGLGERVGSRGFCGCRGCITRDLGCKRCGNHVGYRLLKPCVYCSIVKPRRPGVPPTTGSLRSIGAGGGVAGGGTIDSMTFYFRLDRVSTLERKLKVPPSIDFKDETNSTRVRPVEEEQVVEGRGTRRREKSPQSGQVMLWKHIPNPQSDFEAGLISEPLDWLDPDQETWWLEHSIKNHSYSLPLPLDRRTTAPRRTTSNPESTDVLSSATTTVSTPTTATTSTGGRQRGGSSTLNRSGAIRLTIPLPSRTRAPVDSSNDQIPSADQVIRPSQEAIRLYNGIQARLGGSTTRTSVGGIVGMGHHVLEGLDQIGYGNSYRQSELESQDDDQGDLDRGKRKRSRQSIGR
ncbi:uncharacterized protein JCM15063_002941 [Sporobolomyces koalae]|uniref:uncharacterized protein n=1 Tax=Sporobolomyces koalae TaxID=500713 RepID=UPI00317B0460